MFNSLSSFYNSDVWRAFRQSVIAEAIEADDAGLLRSEFSGDVIVNQYECILHHKIPLTMQNVNDYSVSLNRDNIMLVTYQEHNIIHKRFSGQLSSWQRKVYVVFGSPCSGKSTFVHNNISMGDVVLDMDSIWSAVSGQAAHIYPYEIKPIVFGVREYLLQQIKMRAGKWECAWVISTEVLPSAQDRLLELVNGEPIYIDTDKDTCLARLYADDTRDKEVFTKLIDEWFEKYFLYGKRQDL